jgi:hypothetical protein
MGFRVSIIRAVGYFLLKSLYNELIAFTTFQFMITVLGFIAAGLMILQSFNDWGESPLLTTIQSIDTPITDLLFPSVTVCQGL